MRTFLILLASIFAVLISSANAKEGKDFAISAAGAQHAWVVNFKNKRVYWCYLKACRHAGDVFGARPFDLTADSPSHAYTISNDGIITLCSANFNGQWRYKCEHVGDAKKIPKRTD